MKAFLLPDKRARVIELNVSKKIKSCGAFPIMGCFATARCHHKKETQRIFFFEDAIKHATKKFFQSLLKIKPFFYEIMSDKLHEK